MKIVLRKILSKYNDVGDVAGTGCPLQLAQNAVNHGLEGGRSTEKVKRHYLEFKQDMRCDKCCRFSVSMVYLNLAVMRRDVEG